MKMKAVVTGGGGFLGSAIVDELVRRGYQVVSYDLEHKYVNPSASQVMGSILESHWMRKYFEGADVIYHMAGALGTSELNDQIFKSVETNIVGSLNVFDIALAAGVKKVFFPSKPNPWVNSYTITKTAVEGFAKLYNTEKGMRISSLRYFNVYGPRQSVHPIRKIVPYFACQAMLRMPLEVFGSGHQTTDMVYSEDVAKITVDFVEKDYIDEIPDLGRGIAVCVNEIAHQINHYFGNNGIKYIPMRNGETPDTKLVANNNLIQCVLGNFVYSDWEESLKNTLSFYKSMPSKDLADAVRYYNWQISKS